MGGQLIFDESGYKVQVRYSSNTFVLRLIKSQKKGVTHYLLIDKCIKKYTLVALDELLKNEEIKFLEDGTEYVHLLKYDVPKTKNYAEKIKPPALKAKCDEYAKFSNIKKFKGKDKTVLDTPGDALSEEDWSDITGAEGKPKLEAHIKRERNPKLRQAKIQSVRREHGCLKCEICHDREDTDTYPQGCAGSRFEVHHKLPLFSEERETKMEDLALLCANCHRSVHASKEVENNFKALQKHFAKGG